MMTIGQRIKELRKERGITQREFASIFNVNHSTLAMWEVNKNQPDIETLKKLANFFEVTIDYLTGYTDEWLNEKPQIKTSPVITEDERKLLKLYNELSPERQREATVWLKTLKDLDAQADKTSKFNKIV